MDHAKDLLGSLIDAREADDVSIVGSPVSRAHNYSNLFVTIRRLPLLLSILGRMLWDYGKHHGIKPGLFLYMFSMELRSSEWQRVFTETMSRKCKDRSYSLRIHLGV